VELDSSLFDAQFLLGQCFLKIKDNKNAKKSILKPLLNYRRNLLSVKEPKLICSP